MWRKFWDVGKGEIPYPRLAGESKKTWLERAYAQLESDWPDSDDWMGEERVAYVEGFSIANTFWRAFWIGAIAAIGLIYLLR